MVTLLFSVTKCWHIKNLARSVGRAFAYFINLTSQLIEIFNYESRKTRSANHFWRMWPFGQNYIMPETRKVHEWQLAFGFEWPKCSQVYAVSWSRNASGQSDWLLFAKQKPARWPCYSLVVLNKPMGKGCGNQECFDSRSKCDHWPVCIFRRGLFCSQRWHVFRMVSTAWSWTP